MTHRVFDVLNRRKQTATAKFVFTDTKGGYRKSIQGLRKTMDKVGLQDITLHGLRHTCASKLVQNGFSIYEVKELLGHTDIQTTMKYAHLDTSKVMVKAKDILDQLNL